jgi:prepilin-type processing-associated H-X9-DG protein
VKCLSNLRSIGQAAFMYSNDNKGVILPVQVRTGGTPGSKVGVGDPLDIWPFLLVAGKYLPNPNINGIDAPVSANSVFVCPSVRDLIITRYNFPGSANMDLSTSSATATDATLADGVRRYASVILLPHSNNVNNGANGACIIDSNYAMNGSSGSDAGVAATANVDANADMYLPSQAVYTVKSNGYNYGIVYKLGSFKKAANTVFLLDGFGENLFNTAQGTGYIWRISGARHGQRFRRDLSGAQLFSYGTTNVLFLDGHCEGVNRADLPFQKGGGGTTGSGKANMLASAANQNGANIQNSRIVWNIRQ